MTDTFVSVSMAIASLPCGLNQYLKTHRAPVVRSPMFADSSLVAFSAHLRCAASARRPHHHQTHDVPVSMLREAARGLKTASHPGLGRARAPD
jgi:hypothetical protein